MVEKIEGPAGGCCSGREISFDHGVAGFDVGRAKKRLAGEIAKDEIEGVAIVVGEEARGEKGIDAEFGGEFLEDVGGGEIAIGPVILEEEAVGVDAVEDGEIFGRVFEEFGEDGSEIGAVGVGMGIGIAEIGDVELVNAETGEFDGHFAGGGFAVVGDGGGEREGGEEEKGEDGSAKPHGDLKVEWQ